ncbi:hypothetical protein HW555_006068 [Spodoptera exigua]|uniref:NADP-dependent oxidoreductase domain-containing protein n=1 Tax=Spodoptera exigua TaxID=7107 RepID=A0A835L5R1_SPOEX|nr:hypothetical protein HW555_006068 [Spodoptera exigua]
MNPWSAVYSTYRRLAERTCQKFKMVRVPTVTFNNGQKIPAIGIGTWKSKPGEVTEAVKTAIDVGYRHIDCAFVYGNEKEVGAAISAKIADGTVKREDLFVTSKLWNTFHRPDLEDGELFPKTANDSIAFSDVDYVDTWKALEPLVGEGLVKSIGVSNFNSKQIARLLEHASIVPVTNQIECHPYLNQRRLKDFCEARNIKITAYSPLGSPDRPWAKPDDPSLLEDPKLKAIADRLGKTVAQVLIRYQIDRDNIVIPKSVTASRIASNFDVFDFKLSQEDMSLIDTFDCNGRMVPMTASLGHKYHPFEKEEF